MSKYTTHTDDALYLLFSSTTGEATHALEEVYNRHSQKIYAYCRRILGDDQLAADMLQETFIRYFDKGKAGVEVQNHMSYLFRVARNLCYTTRERNQRVVNESSSLEIAFNDTPYHQKELINLIHVTLDTLPKDLREAFVLREYNGLNYNEIADVIGESIDVVKVRIFRAKKKLRETLKPYVHELNK